MLRWRALSPNHFSPGGGGNQVPSAILACSVKVPRPFPHWPYYHFEFPAKSMASVHRALRPGGQVVVVDFRRIQGQSSAWVFNHVRAGQEVSPGRFWGQGSSKSRK
jgi:hypothetical protein